MAVVGYILGLELYFPDRHAIPLHPLRDPKKGQAPLESEPVIDTLVEAMEGFFRGLYSDTEGVRYRKEREGRSIDYELIFEKRVEGRR